MDLRDAVFDLVLAIVNIDGKVDPKESEALSHFLLTNYGLDAESAIEAAMDRGKQIKTVEDAERHINRAIDVIKKYASKQEQMNILKMLIAFGIVDGNADPSEVSLLRLISNKLGIDLEKAISEMKNEA